MLLSVSHFHLNYTLLVLALHARNTRPPTPQYTDKLLMGATTLKVVSWVTGMDWTLFRPSQPEEDFSALPISHGILMG